MAQWITRRSTEPKIAGSTPAEVENADQTRILLPQANFKFFDFSEIPNNFEFKMEFYPIFIENL